MDITSISISGAAELAVGDHFALSVTVLPANADDTSLVWASNSPSVATVNEASGEVTAVGEGYVVISAAATDGSGVFDTHNITVSEAVTPPNPTDTIIADHSIMREIYFNRVPESAIENAKAMLNIGYGHTSHGSQLTSGMSGLLGFVNANNGGSGESDRFTYSDNLFTWSEDGSSGLHLFEGDGYMPGGASSDPNDDHLLTLDLGYSGWDDETRHYLDTHPTCNVIMWAWCGQVGAYGSNLSTLYSHYFDPMEALESEYPDVVFVYMTGHLESVPDEEISDVLTANNHIRDYCRENDKVLFDFADIEKYNLGDPGDYGGSIAYFGDLYATDGCFYNPAAEPMIDSNSNNEIDQTDASLYGYMNWATEWQDAHVEGVDWFDCYAAHSQPVNANQKAYAVWWLWARIAGWEG